MIFIIRFSQEYRAFKIGQSSRITQERINLLNELGFAWDGYKGHRKECVSRSAEHGKKRRAESPLNLGDESTAASLKNNTAQSTKRSKQCPTTVTVSRSFDSLVITPAKPEGGRVPSPPKDLLQAIPSSPLLTQETNLLLLNRLVLSDLARRQQTWLAAVTTDPVGRALGVLSLSNILNHAAAVRGIPGTAAHTEQRPCPRLHSHAIDCTIRSLEQGDRR